MELSHADSRNNLISVELSEINEIKKYNGSLGTPTPNSLLETVAHEYNQINRIELIAKIS